MSKFKMFHETGRTMIEMLGVISILGMMALGGAVGVSRAIDVWHGWQVQTQVPLLIRDVKALYAWQFDYTKMDMRTICENIKVNNEGCTNLTFKSPWGGQIIVKLGDNNRYGFDVEYHDVPTVVLKQAEDMSFPQVASIDIDEDNKILVFSTYKEDDGLCGDVICLGAAVCDEATVECVCPNGGNPETGCKSNDPCEEMNCEGECLTGDCENGACVPKESGISCTADNSGICDGGQCVCWNGGNIEEGCGTSITLGNTYNGSFEGCFTLGWTDCDKPEAFVDPMGRIEPSACCDMCENREMTEDGVCILSECPDGYQRDAVGGCFSCEDNKSFIGMGDCSACDGYVPDETMGIYCVPQRTCPTNYTVSITGDCVDCNSLAPVFWTASEAECNNCPNREWNGMWCVTTEWPNEVPECPEGETFLMDGRTGESTCISCSSDYVWNTEPGPFEYGGCDCDNRVDVENTYLCIKKCPDDKPVGDNYGNCYACDEPRSIDFSGPLYGPEITYFHGQCGKCGNQRFVQDYACHLNPCKEGEMWNGTFCEKKCASDTDCPNGQLCLSDNTSCVHANYNTCKSYEVVEVDQHFSHVKKIKIDGDEYVSYWDALGACTALGGYLDGWGDVVLSLVDNHDAWLYSSTSCSAKYGKDHDNFAEFNAASKNSASAKAICVFHN